MKSFERHCFENNLKLTPLRKKIFEFLLKEHQPRGAYEILDMLRDSGFSSAPPIAYRVLDFLIEQGFVHKIKRLNSFVACSHPGNIHSPAFMICRKCEKVAEIDEKKSGIDLKKAAPLNFQIEEAVIEVVGICTFCITAEGKNAS
ncbi:MAG: Fur family transcriptional regulator [Rhodobacteraceae bacterium]|nr:Fur family transcriptional regulator [Paracoccaceae bacterium]|tara:strand:+ start:169 stop:603 length:435 start_codon:yes stop_codon:yes gene_type:complete